MTLRLDPPPQIAEFGAVWKKWLYDIYERVGAGPFKIRSYTISALPDAKMWGDAAVFTSLIYITDESGGAVIAYSDGTNWRRVTDQAIVS